MAKSSTNCNVRLEESSRSENSYDDIPASCDPVLAASKRPEQLELHQEVKVGPPGTIPPERGLLELHQEVKVGPPGTMPPERGALERHQEVKVGPPGTMPRETGQLELHLEVKVGPPGTIPPETGELELHLKVKVVPPGTIPPETGATAECTQCVKKGYTSHRCCDDVPGESRGPHQQASS